MKGVHTVVDSSRDDLIRRLGELSCAELLGGGEWCAKGRPARHPYLIPSPARKAQRGVWQGEVSRV